MPGDDEIQKLQAEIKALRDANAALTSEKGRAENQKAIAEADRAAILAQIPPTETKPLEGKLTVDATVTTEIQKLAQEALAEAVQKMTCAIRETLPQLTTVVIYNDKDLSTLADYSTVMRQLRLLVDGYRRNGKDQETQTGGGHELALAAPLLIPAIAGAAVKSVIDLISLFRTNVDIKGATISFDDASLIAQIAKQFRHADKHAKTRPASASIEVVYSALYLPGILSAADADTSELLTTLNDVSAMRQNAEVYVAAFDAKSVDDKALDPNRTIIGELRSLNSGYDRLLSSLSAVGSQPSLASLTSLLRGEVLSRKMQNDRSAILFVKAAGGGENKTSQNLWRSAKLSHSGTAILTYLLFTISDGLKLSDVISTTRNAAD